LELFGATVLEASEAAHALEISDAFEGDIHVMVSDVVMPGMNGADLAKAMLLRRPGIRIQLISGYTDKLAVRKDGRIRGFPLLSKPFSANELSQALRDLMGEEDGSSEGE
jgi:YesN/AraC family two-component response regulator